MLKRQQSKGYLGRSEVPQGLDVLVQGQAAGQVVPVAGHHIHQACWQQGGHILGDGREDWAERASETPQATGWVRSEHLGRTLGAPGRNGTRVMTGQRSRPGQNGPGVHEQCRLGLGVGVGTGVTTVTKGVGQVQAPGHLPSIFWPRGFGKQ